MGSVNRQAAAEIVDVLARHQVSNEEIDSLFLFIQSKVRKLPIHYQMLQDQARHEAAVQTEQGVEIRAREIRTVKIEEGRW